MKHDQWRALPDQIRALPICPPRQLPIPFTTAIDQATGEGQFATTDQSRVEDCWQHDLCAVCAKPLGDWVAFLDGPGSADRWRGAYTDPWMHEQCAEVSLTICPY